MVDFKIPKGLLKPSSFETPEGQLKIKTYINKYTKDALAAGVSKAEIRDKLKPFKVGNKQIEIQGFSKTLDGRAKHVTLYDSAKRADKNAREVLLETMGDKTGAAKQTKYGRKARNLKIGQQDHHIFFRTLFEPFYKGRSQKEQLELTNWFVKQGTPLGNVLENLEGIDSDLHQENWDSLHSWAKDNQIDVKAFTKDEWAAGNRNIMGGFARGGADNEIVDTGKKIKGMQGPELPKGIKARAKVPGAKFPNFEGKDLDYVKKAAKEWIDLIKEPLLDKTASILEIQDQRNLAQDPNYKAKNKSQWLDKFNNDFENAAARAKVIDKAKESGLTITGADLDTAKPINKLAGTAEDALTIGKLGKKLTRLAPIPVASTLLGGMAAVASENQQRENPNPLNWTQMQADRVSVAGSGLSTASLPLLATPLAPVGAAGVALGETIDAVGTGVSLSTDVIRGALNPAKIRGRSGAKRALDPVTENQVDLASKGF